METIQLSEECIKMIQKECPHDLLFEMNRSNEDGEIVFHCRCLECGKNMRLKKHEMPTFNHPITNEQTLALVSGIVLPRVSRDDTYESISAYYRTWSRSHYDKGFTRKALAAKFLFEECMHTQSVNEPTNYVDIVEKRYKALKKVDHILSINLPVKCYFSEARVKLFREDRKNKKVIAAFEKALEETLIKEVETNEIKPIPKDMIGESNPHQVAIYRELLNSEFTTKYLLEDAVLDYISILSLSLDKEVIDMTSFKEAVSSEKTRLEDELKLAKNPLIKKVSKLFGTRHV
jgi:hypothetical protein